MKIGISNHRGYDEVGGEIEKLLLQIYPNII